MDKEYMNIDYTQICVCANLRKKTRVVTQMYDKLLQPTNLKITQYSMLANIDHQQAVSISKLGEILLLDQTTITRNVNLLKQSGYVAITPDKQDARTKILSLTDVGIAKLKEATPIWHEIQEKIINDIGPEKYKDFYETLRHIQKIIKSYDNY
ncbi:DNA-binding MarR family transcriptional regulator [Lysinibacillus parviboronicapiens]|uniref:DNA-binding MarR family transcriptional regulator n=1 Tax=Lysinibacillus parviboronicapiens TaxID=436516 RepID=A0ABV2PM78_9BACI